MTHSSKKDYGRQEKVWMPQAFAVGMLLWAFNPSNPYGYYILLRWVCCGTFSYLAVKGMRVEAKGWVWVYGITALVYNPIFKVHLDRSTWGFVNFLTIIIALGSIRVLATKTIE